MSFSRKLLFFALDVRNIVLYNLDMQINGAIFDLDGTILDSMEMWLNAGELFLNSLGIKAKKNLGAALLQMNVEEGAFFIQKEYKLNLSVKEIIEGTASVVKKTYTEKIQPKPGVQKLLELLSKNKIPCVILTGSDRQMFEDCLKKHKLDGFFKEILTCSGLKMSKSNPGIYSVAAKNFNSKAENVLVFEDAPDAIKSAKKAGFYTIGIYDSCTHSNSDICSAKESSDIFCKNFDEATEHIENLLRLIGAARKRCKENCD